MQDDDPVQMFAQACCELISTGKARIADRKTGRAPHIAETKKSGPPPQNSYSAEDAARWGGWSPLSPQGPIIGYVDKPATGTAVHRINLCGATAYGLVQELLRRRDQSLPGKKTLWRAMVSAGLVTPGTDRSEQKVRCGSGHGVPVWVLVAKLAIIGFVEADASTPPHPADPDDDPF
jgi:hypothetical protein